ncbi:MAG: lysophospholipid acyltransferase family protein [Nonlabens ulvanivorans]|nr:lysophospholipid acyltransferase family protein [Nonlabens ulvanivorans]WOI23804.1 lysophospholipid acyltransferase family protein [Nonlabens ulvanivorans]
MQAIAFYLFYPLLWIISRLPARLTYLLSDFAFLIVYYVIGYRKKVIINNLKIAFPEKSEIELKELCRKTTQHFCDSFIEVIMSMSMSHDEMLSRFEYTNLELIHQFRDQKRPIIVMFGHQASYEWTMCIDGLVDYKIIAVYKPLANKYFNKLIVDIRQKFNSTMITMREASNNISQSISNGDMAMYGLIADQSPAKYRAQHFTTFFGKTSAVFMGSEKLAKAHDTAVVYLAVEKIKRGHYKANFQTITEHAAQTKDWEITDTFLDLLEKQIRKQPEYYLWSHKRWKATPENIKRKPVLSPRVQQ